MRIVNRCIGGLWVPVCEKTGELVENVVKWNREHLRQLVLTLDGTLEAEEPEPYPPNVSAMRAARRLIAAAKDPNGCPFCGAGVDYTEPGRVTMWECATIVHIVGGDESRRDYIQSPHCLKEEERHEEA